MSKTDRQEKRWPREREFPYIPHGVPVLQIGRPYSAESNAAYVRALYRARYPDEARWLESAVTEILQGEAGARGPAMKGGTIVTEDEADLIRWGSDAG